MSIIDLIFKCKPMWNTLGTGSLNKMRSVKEILEDIAGGTNGECTCGSWACSIGERNELIEAFNRENKISNNIHVRCISNDLIYKGNNPKVLEIGKIYRLVGMEMFFDYTLFELHGIDGKFDSIHFTQSMSP